MPKCILSSYRTSYNRFTMHSYTTNKIFPLHHSSSLFSKSVKHFFGESSQWFFNISPSAFLINIGQISCTVPARIQAMQTIIKQISCQDYLLGNLIKFNFSKNDLQVPGVKVKVKVMKDLHANIYFITSNDWRVFTGK